MAEEAARGRTALPIPIDQLHLDDENPRLPEPLIHSPEPRLLKYLFDTGALEELALSLADNGFFSHEPLIVSKEARRGGYVVLEGNRRLATLMILLGSPHAEGITFDNVELSKARRAELSEVPCFEVLGRDQVFHFLGFRHIGGLKTWSPEAKARYLAKEIDSLAAEGKVANPFEAVARQVGTDTPGVRNSYVGLSILRAAKSEHGLDVSRITSETEHRFGVWLRCIQSPALRSYIGFNNAVTYAEVKNQLKKLDPAKLKEVLSDLLPRADGRPPVLDDSRDVTVYGRALTDKRAHSVLRKTGDLDLARQVVDELDLPSRIRKIARKCDVLREEVEAVQMTQDLKDAIGELTVKVRTLNSLAKDDSE
jgi:hypothetical protein